MALMTVFIVLVGTLQTFAGFKKRSVELKEKALISTLLQKLNTELFGESDLLNSSNLLILINGKEISVLKGLQTELMNNDAITLIPISHGG